MNGYINEFTTLIAHPFVLMLLGLYAHFARKQIAAAVHASSVRPRFKDLWTKNKLQTSVSFVGAFAGYAMFAHFPDFDKMNVDVQNVIRGLAFGIGFMADSIVDAAGRKAIKKVEET